MKTRLAFLALVATVGALGAQTVSHVTVRDLTNGTWGPHIQGVSADFDQTNNSPITLKVTGAVMGTNSGTTNIALVLTINGPITNNGGGIFYGSGGAATNDLWLGPTNSLDFSLSSMQTYSATTDCALTNLVNVPAQYERTVSLQIINNAGSDKVLTLAQGWLTPDGARTYTLTNGQVTDVTVNTRRVVNRTNAIVVNFR